MDAFKKLRKMYNDAGVTIYAWKQLSASMSDEEFEYIFNVAEALGCTHTTLELLTDGGAEAHRRLRDEEEDLRGVPHARAGQHDRVRPGVRVVEGQHGERRLRPLGRGWQRRRHADAVPREAPRSDLELPPEGSDDAGPTARSIWRGAPARRRSRRSSSWSRRTSGRSLPRSSSNTTSPKALTP